MLKRILCMVLILALSASLLAVPGYAAESTSANEKEMYYYLTGEMGLTPAAACGIMANAYYETGFRADITSGTYYGLFMYYSKLAEALKAWCVAAGEDYSTVRGQMLYLKAMFTCNAGSWNYSSLYASLKALGNTAEDAYEAGYLFCVKFEKPANAEAAGEKRGTYAKTVLYPKYAGTNATDLSGSTATTGSSGSSATTDWAETSSSYTAFVTASALNVRKGPGTGYASTGTVKYGTQVSVTSTAKDSAGTTWAKLSTGGWVSTKYLSDTASKETASNPAASSADTVAYTVTASTLNIRKGAGTSYAITGTLKKGTSVTVTEETKTSSGSVWCKLSTGGWVCKNYLQAASSAGSSGTSCTVTANGLNVRKGAGTGYAVVRCLQKGTTVTIVSTEKDSSGTTWGKLADGNWICMRYVK